MLRRRDHRTPDLDKWLHEKLEALICEAEAQGRDPQLVIEGLGNSIETIVNETAPQLIASLKRTAPRMLREHRRIARRFEKRLRKNWGRALDMFYALCVCALEIGEEFAYRNEAVARKEGDLVYEAAVGLHARACRVATEVHTLLEAGFPYGARARCRTLHEIAVTTCLLTEHGRSAEYSDLAERFFLHDAMMRYREAVDYQERCRELDMEPFSEQEMEEMKDERDQLIQRFGPSFKRDYGWAAPLAPSLQFREIEACVNMSHLRSYYAWASNEVHSGVRGWVQNHIDFRGQTIRLAGRTNNELTDPAQMAMISLLQVTTALLVDGSTQGPTLIDLLALNAMQKLLEDATSAFMAAQDAIDQAEEKHEAHLNRAQNK
ncbi:hypothetical protein FHX41_4927 [Actinomadura hallensis]|uniref:Uncharacterized protein n=1 Tax=Actinomadura hallensis TaxID=337895 RepID=A0A543IKR8_9ACTN|nr:DUF5677 domain-containing protein [Actinomadura hallensis]TQM71175.1 hypothetical protein FHX41_4927 [Actinomadura hallensis]